MHAKLGWLGKMQFLHTASNGIKNADNSIDLAGKEMEHFGRNLAQNYFIYVPLYYTSDFFTTLYRHIHILRLFFCP